MPLLVDGAAPPGASHRQAGGLSFRAVLAGGTYFVAICPLGQEDQARLVTR